MATPTLQDIADIVGVSRVTVSRVLRGKVKGCWPKSAAQAQRIRDVAEEIGYRVDWKARTLKTGKTFMVGLLSTEKKSTQIHDASLLGGLVEGLGDAGYHLTFVRVAAGARGSGFADSRFDGLLIDYHLEPEEIAVIQEAQLPAVIINAPGLPGVDSVMPDHRAAGRLAAGHLLGLGHRRIAMLHAPTSEHKNWPRHMYEGWRSGLLAAMRRAGCGDGFRDVIPEALTREEHDAAYASALDQVFAEAEPPTALVTLNSEQAMNVGLRNLRRLGLDCPRDVSLLCMHGVEAHGWTSPELTDLDFDFAEIGRRAARLLLHQMEPDREQAKAKLCTAPKPRLMIRGSTAPAPAGR
ncbi:LacI family DNA-binding transcriptional regulator [Phycisphaera mikurensis]|uniref:LacI family transcriptional regulator n=1 Tax=Phycisphaera mikurensis (strain NBRC 102666 / KCTC 22515 / FYK2301M01) TaxID=1142394 RepID=I0IHY6_PHYMF|nr:LacI family DNA-binding transcriptional regulator [Phycisphaera mikurensis]MBB6441113.1 LacI family transcriptional regulator [Phycisphaera mikurensis]BAM04874.1 LacI family transcriptional regulator [Phycisphaera mikurensis NBRC 102666]